MKYLIKNSIVVLLSVLLLLGGCRPTPKDGALTIAVAASAQFALKQLADVFAEKNGIKVEIISGSSGKLTVQILNGAPYDLFFAANVAYPNTIFEEGLSSNAPIVYGKGVPVLWTLKKELALDAIQDRSSFSDLQRVVIANPKNAPYGEIAQAYLEDNNLLPALQEKLVYGENISQVNEYILNGTVDFGFSAKSIVVSPQLQGEGYYKELPSTYWIDQGAIVIDNDHSAELKAQFMQFVQSEEGIVLLRKNGYEIN